jgi:hypothetical protein
MAKEWIALVTNLLQRLNWDLYVNGSIMLKCFFVHSSLTIHYKKISFQITSP